MDHDDLEPGLWLVAVPIGAARDITLRALDILGAAQVLVAEDTRSLRRLMEIHGVALAGRPLWSYHDRSKPAARDQILRALAAGRSVAYAAEAGTPLVADPGYRLVSEAAAAGHPVRAAPGPSAALAALCVSGLPTDRFLFAGFPPAAAGARRRWVAEIAAVPATLVVYESPRRIRETLEIFCDACGADRRAVVARELTKRFEEVRRGTLGSLSAAFEDAPRGEVVLVIDRAGDAPADDAAVADALGAALSRLPTKAAAAEVAERFGLPRREVYQMALARLDRPEEEE